MRADSNSHTVARLPLLSIAVMFSAVLIKLLREKRWSLYPSGMTQHASHAPLFSA
jgi:hypothetical protein